MAQEHSLFPIYLDLSGRRVLVVGGGAVACRKVGGLLAASANIAVVARRVDSRLEMLAGKGYISLHIGDYESHWLDGCSLVIPATDDTVTNQTVYDDARARGIFCNVVDVPELCDFHIPAVVRRGPLQIAISTAGASPTMAGQIKKQLTEQYGPEYAVRLKVLAAIRQRLKHLYPDEPATRMRINKTLASNPRLQKIDPNDIPAIDQIIKDEK